jgi:nondiscriminating glutamyl-tRNA synthetase
MIRTRFAPSPTGFLHVGGLRTALYAYLVAKQSGGQFALRIEDTDQERFVEGGIENILKSLYWAGVVPDEGVVLKNGNVAQSGKKGPYIQSERLAIYKKYAQQLLDGNHAYYCFCTSERLTELREFQQKTKIATGYDGRCSKIDPQEAQKRVAAGERCVIRVRMPKDGETVVNDLVHGEVRFKNTMQEDFVAMKSDGFPTYHLASVVDDTEMEFTHVIRGEEWVSSLPKHVQLYKALGLAMPQFAHLPLLLNADKSKLSKRQGDVAVSDYEQKGYLPEALVNFVAFLGWSPGTNKEMYTLDELIKDFSVEKVSKAGAVFNIEKLNWFNKEYLKKLSPREFYERALPWLSGLPNKPAEWVQKALGLERERITTLSELPSAIRFMFELPEYEAALLVWKKGSMEEVKTVLPKLAEFLKGVNEKTWNKEKLEEVVKNWIGEQGLTTGSVLWPLRVSLSGQQNSPGPFEIAEVLGKDETLERLKTALKKLSA